MEKKIKNIEELLEDQQKQHDREKKLLYKQIEKLLDKVGNTTNIQHNNIESNIQNNIILNNYGKEDLSHITDTFKISESNSTLVGRDSPVSAEVSSVD